MLAPMSVTPPASAPPTGLGLVTPLPLAVRSMLRSAVFEHARGERRRLFPAQLHVGTPGGSRVSSVIAEAPTDFGTRVDLIHAMIRRAEAGGVSTPTRVPWVWLTRSGPAITDDLDLSVLAPTMHAFSEAALPLSYVVITSRGWHDPRSGLSHSWVRVRAAESVHHATPVMGGGTARSSAAASN